VLTATGSGYARLVGYVLSVMYITMARFFAP
jgi:hypothetical protein